MKLKKNIAGAAAVAIVAVVLPRIMLANTVSAANSPDESTVFFADSSVMAVIPVGTEIALPNSIVVEEYGDFKYTLNKDGTLYITDYNSEIENIVFPSEIDGKTVTGVDIRDDFSKKHITVTVPASVTQIRIPASSGDSNLKEIIIDEGNKNYASKDGVLFNKDFTMLVRYPAGKSNEEPEYTLPDTVNNIIAWGFVSTNMTAVHVTDNNTSFSSVDGVLFSKDKTELVFYPRCKSGKEFVVPETVTSIGSGAFESCKELASVTLQEGLKTIKKEAFVNCSEITSIVIPASVSAIENGAFAYTSLESITVDENNKYYFTEDGVLFNKDASILILYPPKKSGTTYTIPDTVETVGFSAFAFAGICELNFGKNVSVIEGSAFQDCKMSSVVLPESIKVVETFSFPYCTLLNSITVPAGLERMGNVTIDTDNYNGMMDYNGDIENVFYCVNNLTIHGTPGTVAEKYAIYWGIQFNENPIISDEKTGINVMTPEGAVPDGTVLNVEEKNSEEYPNSAVYEITLTLGEQKVQPNGNVSVRIPIPDGSSGSELKVYYRDENGKLTDMKAVVSGNYIVFVTNHFSEYILTAEKLALDVTLGDVNGDTKINDQDSILLSRFLAEWGNEINTAAADINGDGRVNDQDSIMLARTLAGWYD